MQTAMVRAAIVAALVAAGCGGAAPGSGSTATSASVPASTLAPASPTAHATPAATRTPAPSIPTGRPIQPTGQVDLTGALNMVVAGDELWVRDADSVHRIDPDALEVVETVRVPVAFEHFAIAGDAVWITDLEGNAVVGYAVATGEEVARIPVGASPNMVFAAAGSIWGSNLRGHWIERIDPEGRASMFEWDDAALAGPVVAAPTADAVWFTAYDSQRLIAIDPDTNGLAASIKVPVHPCGATVFPSFILGTACFSKATVRVDPATGTVLGTHSMPAHTYSWYRAGGLFWSIQAPGHDAPTRILGGFDPATLEQRDAVDVGAAIQGVAITFDALWISTKEGVLRFDLSELEGR